MTNNVTGSVTAVQSWIRLFPDHENSVVYFWCVRSVCSLVIWRPSGSDALKQASLIPLHQSPEPWHAFCALKLSASFNLPADDVVDRSLGVVRSPSDWCLVNIDNFDNWNLIDGDHVRLSVNTRQLVYNQVQKKGWPLCIKLLINMLVINFGNDYKHWGNVIIFVYWRTIALLSCTACHV